MQRMRAPFLVILVTYTISIIGFLIIPGVDNSGMEYHLTIFDAFYIITYTATTIGFGEIPYAFTYPQRMWMSFSIYFNVLGWFYGIGSLISLFQDKLLLQEFAKNRFKRHIKGFKEKYIIVLGYNIITSEIIKKATEAGMRVVVIEKDEAKINELLLENFTPPVPVLSADTYSPTALMMAGVNSVYCKAVVVLLQDDELNLRIALTVKLLNPKMKLAVEATTQHHVDNLKDIGVDIIENPFGIIANQIERALNSSNILRLERWIYGFKKLTEPVVKLPKGNYVMCGFGRMGEGMYKAIKEKGYSIKCIEKDIEKLKSLEEEDRDNIFHVEDYDKKNLLSIGTQDASLIIAGTKNDTTNLSIAITAKKLNPKIVTVVRENGMEDFSVFKNAKIDYIMMPSRILIDKTINAILRPSADIFVKNLDKLSDKEAVKIIKTLLEIDNDPILFELNISKESSYEIYKRLDDGESITLDIFRRSLKNRDSFNNLFVFIILRDKKEIMLPSWDEKIYKNDQILFASDENGLDEAKLIANNFYEFEFAYYGKEYSKIRFLQR